MRQPRKIARTSFNTQPNVRNLNLFSFLYLRILALKRGSFSSCERDFMCEKGNKADLSKEQSKGRTTMMRIVMKKCCAAASSYCKFSFELRVKLSLKLIQIIYVYCYSPMETFAAIDIGGTLAKLSFIVKTDSVPNYPHLENMTIRLANNHSVLFYHFGSQEILSIIQYFKKYLSDVKKIALSGGGSFKFEKEFSQLNKEIVKIKQFDSLIAGLKTLKDLKIEEEYFFFDKGEKVYHNFDPKQFYPILMVNVGSGISMLKVSEKDGNIDCERVGGTCLGGGFFLGLCETLLGTRDFGQLLKNAKQGNNLDVDLGPSDFNHLEKNWPDLMDAPVLVSLGKLSKQANKQDIANSLFVMVASNIAQLSLMQFKLNNVRKVVFTGFFCRNNNFVLECVNRAFSFFMKNHPEEKPVALGIKHDGYLGTLGALYSIIDQRPNV